MSSNWSECHPTVTDRTTTVSSELIISSDLPKLISDSTEAREESDSIEVSSNTCALYWNYLTKSLDDFFVVSLYNDVESVIQMGPKCGLVALLMCRQLITDSKISSDLTQNDLFEIAKQMGFTKTGEMFSVENMAKLANKVLSVGTEVKDNLKEKRNQLVSHLSDGLPVLVPYDSDANHEPTLLAGERAHWAIVLGFCMAIKTERLSVANVIGIRDERNAQLIHLKPKLSLSDSLWDVINTKSYEKLWVYAKQGKSKHLHIWDFERLCDSNCNLVKTSRKLNESEIVLPENGGIKKGLNNKCLFINNN